MNPNGLVPTLEEEDGFLLWESNSVVRYLAGKHDKSGVLEPKDPKQRALASQWMDWQLSVAGPAIFAAFWGLIRTPPEKRDMAAIKTSQEKTTAAMQMLDAQLAKTKFVAGDAFSYGDIPVGIMCYRFVQLVPDRPPMPNLDRWYAQISSRKAFQDHVGSVPLSLSWFRWARRALSRPDRRSRARRNCSLHNTRAAIAALRRPQSRSDVSPCSILVRY